MTVAELIKKLQEIPDKSRLVILEKDDSYTPLERVHEDSLYYETSTWAGIVFSPNEDHIPKEVKPAVVLVPNSLWRSLES